MQRLRRRRFPAFKSSHSRWGGAAFLLILALGPTLIAKAAKAPSATPTAQFDVHSIYDFEIVGITDFPNVYTGGVQESDGSVTFYVTARDPALLAAIAAADTDGKPYRFVIVPYSHAKTHGLVMAIANQSDLLMSEGVRLVAWEPDPRTSLVTVHLETPTDADLAALAAARGVPLSSVTIATYPAQVEALLRSRFGSGLLVDRTYEEPVTLAHRRNDTSPFTGGDDIRRKSGLNFAECTGGFPVVKNGTSVTYMSTAAHCGAGTWKIGDTSTVIGIVSSGERWTPNNGYDFELMPTDVISSVWGGSASTPVRYPLYGGPYFPQVGEPISWDGAITREVRNVTVTKNDGCAIAGQGSEQGKVCNLIQSSNSPVVVQVGDSGGPVFQHTCETCNKVKPIATIVGKTTTTAYAQWIGVQLDVSLTHIDD